MSAYDDSIRPWLGAVFDCACGRAHAVGLRHAVIADHALEDIPAWLQSQGFLDVLIVADARTLATAGERVAELLNAAGHRAVVCRVQDNARGEVVADEDAITQVMVALQPPMRAVLAVGSGTLHDVVRFVCHRAGRAFISVPTAPSVDGFVSTGAPIVLRGFKQTIPAIAPDAVFADLKILAAAPRPLIAAGFGDMLGKFTSLADWRLGRLLLDEPYCEQAAELTVQGLRLCLDGVEEIAAATPAGVGRLMEGLLLSGISMLMVGNSRPASGSEHHLSHFWEMRYLQEGRQAELHGAKVGVACARMADLYQRLRHMPVRDVEQALDTFTPPDANAERERITATFGPIAPQVLTENAEAESPSPCAVEERWREVRSIADSVPEPERLTEWLRRVGGPATPEDLGIAPDLVAEAVEYAMYVRNRYTVLRLARMVARNP